MKRIKTGELYRNLSAFLGRKGIEFTDGSYTQRIRKSCALLSDAINCTQETLETAKGKVDRKLDRLRQTIHEKTAPQSPSAPPPKGASAKTKKTRPRKPAK